MNCGKKIYRLRKSNGMTQEELGKVLNVTYQAVSKWERGESMPDFDTISKLAGYFEVPLEYFVDGSESQKTVAPTKQEQDSAQPEQNNINYIGTCSECGKLLKEGDEYSTNPKIICKNCVERQQQARENKLKQEKIRNINAQRGTGIDIKLIISLVLSLAAYVLFAVMCFNASDFDDASLYGALMFFVPLAVFGLVHSITEFIQELLLHGDDESDGYTRNLSLIVGAVFAVINLILYLVLYLTSNEIYYVILLVLGVILSFTFISQFMWGNCVREIFTAGGFTFKLPGFIFTLEIDSILWMIITKFFLGILAAIIFVVTSVIVAAIAILGSAITFIPSIIFKTVKDKKA